MKYISRNCGQEVTAAQYVAETMITRQAQRDKVALPFKFWNFQQHKKAFMSQLFKANALLKLYSEEVLIGAIEKNVWLCTLMWRDIDSILDKEQAEIEMKKKLAETAPKFEEVDVNVSQKKFSSKQGKLSKLRNLDDE